MKTENVAISRIVVGDRHRVAIGDIDGLAESIRETGLLQPVGIDSKHRLIFGYRRLLACDSLGWKQVPCVVLRLKSVLAGEYAENEFRKQFTPSEREAIGRALEQEYEGRHGGDRKSRAADAALDPKGKTADIAAKRAGFGSAETYERAKTVVEKGTPELVAAMDSGEMTIAAAATVATQEPGEQTRILSMPKDKRSAAVKNVRKTRADKAKIVDRQRDLRLFRGLYDAVGFIAEFHEPAAETWAGLSRVYALRFSEFLPRAIACLVRLDKEHPNEPRKPQIVAR